MIRYQNFAPRFFSLYSLSVKSIDLFCCLCGSGIRTYISVAYPPSFSFSPSTDFVGIWYVLDLRLFAILSR